MFRLRVLIGSGLAASALVLVPVASASAHVHGITPLRCTPAPDNAGGNQTDQTPASSANGGPIAPGVIPINLGGAVPLLGGGFNAAVCSR